ncbi:molybdenum formylmethanofuran dehydrogenase, partial [Candidatus Bathyarchaeota archaeon]|nr:molybdenum formylmethanofuran dehydrogenase [Candidatus Bathyarchaeota archaeon]
MIRLHPKRLFKAPVDAQSVTPNIFAEKSISEIAKLQIWEGNQKKTLDQLFKIEQNSKNSSEEMTIQI